MKYDTALKETETGLMFGVVKSQPDERLFIAGIVVSVIKGKADHSMTIDNLPDMQKSSPAEKESIMKWYVSTVLCPILSSAVEKYGFSIREILDTVPDYVYQNKRIADPSQIHKENPPK